MLFTIITVCFNSAKTIRDTFESVLSQSCKDYEYLVIDGASTDGTVEIIKEYEPKFEGRMRWISEKDNGIYDAMNKGIKMAHGEYLNFMNSDDFFEIEALSKCKQVIYKNPTYGIYYGAVRIIGTDGVEEKIIRDYHASLLKKHPMKHQGMFEKRTLFGKYNYFSTKYKIVSDFEHCIRLYLGGETFYPMDFCIATFRAGGISNDIHEARHANERESLYLELGWLDFQANERNKRRLARDQRILSIVHFLMMCCCKVRNLFIRTH